MICGDRDIKPAVEAVLTEFETNNIVEIWSWRHSLSGNFLELAQLHPSRIIIIYLDDYLDQIGFRNQVYNLPFDRIPHEVSLVGLNLCRDEQMIRFMDENVFPVYYFDSGDDKIIICVDRSMRHSDFTNFFLSVKRFFVGNEDKIITFVDYRQLKQTDTFDLVNSFHPITSVESSAPPREEPVERIAEEMKDDWQVMPSRREKSAIARDNIINGRREWCLHGYSCRKGPSKCSFRHLPDHKVHRPAKKIKTCPDKACRYNSYPQRCNFLHPGEIPMCLWCYKQHTPNCYEREKRRTDRS